MSARSRPFYLGIACMLVSAFYDNSRGPLLPILAERFALDYSQSSAFVSMGSLASFFLSLGSVALLARLRLSTYLRAALALQIAAVAAAALGHGFPVLLAAGFLWGGAFAAVGISTNLLAVDGADDRNRSRRLGFTHAFYGIGSGLAGVYVARVVSRGWPLERILFTTVPLAVLLFLAAGIADSSGGDADPAPGFPIRRFLKRRPLLSNASLSFYVLGEVLTSIWMTSFLVEDRGMPLSRASLYLTGFFLALSAGRIAGALLIPAGKEKILRPVLLVAVTACFFGGVRGLPWMFPLGAFLTGPYFPLTVSSFKREYPRAFPGFVAFCFATLTAALTLGHLLMGAVSDAFSLRTAFIIPPACLIAALALDLLRGSMTGDVPAAD